VSAGSDPADRVRTLLLRGDNVLKSGKPERLGRALEAFEEALSVASEPGVDPRLRELAQRRIDSLRPLLEAQE
jgi:hypothetical protein